METGIVFRQRGVTSRKGELLTKSPLILINSNQNLKILIKNPPIAFQADLSFWRKVAKFVYQKLGYGHRITERFGLVDFSGGWRQTRVVDGQIEIIHSNFVARKAVAKLIQFDQQMERPSYIPERKPKWFEDAVPGNLKLFEKQF